MWLTSAIREDLLRELIELQDALGVLKRNTERYMEASQEASEALNGRTGCLGGISGLTSIRVANLETPGGVQDTVKRQLSIGSVVDTKEHGLLGH